MTLKEKVLNRKQILTKEELEKENMSEESQNYEKFLNICDVLKKSMDLKNIKCNTYEDVFLLIEKNHINIEHIISKNQYDKFKKKMLSEKTQWCPNIGKSNEKIYDFTKEEDRLEYMKKHKDVRF